MVIARSFAIFETYLNRALLELQKSPSDPIAPCKRNKRTVQIVMPYKVSFYDANLDFNRSIGVQANNSINIARLSG
jgi:hypothetical protein